MAREHLLVGGEEETIHSNQIVLETKKDIRKNWWHYNKNTVLGVALVIAVAASMVYSVVSKVEPDYQLGLITSASWNDSMITELESYIAQYADDRNGDGNVVVQVNEYILNSSDENQDPNVVQASVVRFSADSTNLDSVIFLHNEGGLKYFDGDSLEGYFNYRDGSPMPEGKLDYENAMFEWTEIEAFNEYQPSGVEEMTYEMSGGDVKTILERYRVSLRSKTEGIEKDEKKTSYYEDSMKLFERLKDNEKYE